MTTWSSGDTLTAAALNSEFNNILTGAVSLLSPWTANMDAGNFQLQNHVLEKFAAAQTAATAGRLYYRTDNKLPEYDTGAAIRTIPNLIPSGGQLTLSGSSLLFAPYTHNLIVINGKLEVIPDAGASLAIGAAAASTAYNIYAYMSGSTLTLEFATTATAIQAGTGVTIKSGDATRSYVGSTVTTAGPAWTAPVSFFNQPAGATLVGSDDTERTTVATSYGAMSTFPVNIANTKTVRIFGNWRKTAGAADTASLNAISLNGTRIVYDAAASIASNANQAEMGSFEFVLPPRLHANYQNAGMLMHTNHLSSGRCAINLWTSGNIPTTTLTSITVDGKVNNAATTLAIQGLRVYVYD